VRPGDSGIDLPAELERDVRILAESIGERNVFRPGALARAVEFIEEELRSAGLEPRRDSYPVRGRDCHNLEVEIPGSIRAREIIVVGAHYDTVTECPGANDNASGVAALLALARRFRHASPRRSLRFVFFVNEEPPFFMSGEMGSLVYARRCAARKDRIRGMLALETIGYFDERPGSQRYPVGFLRRLYPDAGDFIAFVSNLGSWRLLRAALRGYRRAVDGAGVDAGDSDEPSPTRSESARHAGALPRVEAKGAALPRFVPGVGWSDHQAFWAYGFPALMVTDTAPFRYPHYHTSHDTPEKLDYARLARVVLGLQGALAGIAGAGTV
jgi:hypothetical protein